MNMKKARLLFQFAAAFYFVSCLFSARAQGQAPFYQGKTITIVQGRAPGGSGDYRVRAVLPFLQKYIPGNPTFIHEYMDGGGGRKAANHIFALTRSDGLVIGNVGGGVVANAVLGDKGVQYDLDKLPFIGSPYSATHYVFATRRELGLTNLEKLRGATGIRIGAQSVGHTNYTIGRMFAALLGLKDSKYVTGYSIPERDVALLRGEIDAIANTDDFYARNPEWIDKKLVDFHVVMEIPKGLKHPLFSNLPDIENFAKSESTRKLLSLFRLLRLTGSPFILPPPTQKDRADTIKEALRKAFKDAEFVKEYRKVVGEDPTPLLPEENERAIRDLPRDPETIDLFKKFAGAGPLPSL
jgi:tripartite-type tricarboxylate transporter receptor subunit TctC